MSEIYPLETEEFVGRSPSALQRLVVLILYALAWMVFAWLLGPGVRDFFNLTQYDMIVPERELTPAESLMRFVSAYWITAPIFMGIPFAFVSWLALRLHADGGVVRWKWLIANVIAIPAMLVFSWLLFRNFLFLP
jgi:hypothetical protein